IICVAVSVVLIWLIYAVSSIISDNYGKIYGSWEVESTHDITNDYPENNFIIYENGTFTADGVSGTYSINDDTITISALWESYTYQYKMVSSDVLVLRYIEKDDAPSIRYNRIS
ncbi:MAG: hypothetical protein ACI4W6_06625, partial [Acutalibacteraceae bacterium]